MQVMSNEASNQPIIKHNKAVGIAYMVHNQSIVNGHLVGMHVNTTASYTIF